MKAIKILLLLFIIVISKLNSQDLSSIASTISVIGATYLKGMIKNEITTKITPLMDLLKATPFIYSNENKVIIDNIENNLKEFSSATSMFEEEKYLKSLINNFKELINLNGEVLVDMRKYEEMVNILEKGIQFFNDKMEDLNKPTETETNNTQNTQQHSTVIPSSSQYLNNTTEVNKVESNITTTVIIILSVCTGILVFYFIFKFIIQKKQLDSQKVNYEKQIDSF
jgi:hypothetical protein